MSIDGNVNLADLNGGGTNTPFTLSGTLEPGNLTRGDTLLAFYQQGGTFDDIAYVEGSLEGPVALPSFSVNAQGNAGVVLTGSPLDTILPAFAVDAGAGGITLLPFVVDAVAQNSALTTGDAVLLPFASSGSLEPALALPVLDVQATGFVGVVASGVASLLPFAVTATSGTQADASLPLFDVSATGLTGAIASGDVQVRQFVVGADSVQDTVSDGAVTLGLYMVSASGDALARIDGSVTLSPFQIVAAGGVGNTATADMVVPLFAVSASGFMDNVGTVTIELPAFVLGGEAASSSVPASAQAGVPILINGKVAGLSVAAGGVPNTVVLNTRLKAVTMYDGLRANSFATFNGVTLAATAQGIVALTGDDDMGAVIDASVTSGISDLGVPAMKQILTAYVGYRSEDEMELTLITDEHHENSYMLIPVQSGDDLHASRVKFGRGVTGRYWQWKLENRNGAAFDLGHIEFHVQPHKRGV